MPKPFGPILRDWISLRRVGQSISRSHIKRGNAARDRRDWGAAAEAYRAAVSRQPDLVPIWIQLGHALKEQGAILPAIEAYAEAVSRQPRLAEAHIFLGHLHKQQGHFGAAIEQFLSALHAGDMPKHEIDELLRLLAQQCKADRAGLLTLLRGRLELLAPISGETPLLSELRQILSGDISIPANAEDVVDAAAALVFDVSDLIDYYNNARLPTGIQRVQTETVAGALSDPQDREIRLCCFIAGRDDWLEVPIERMRNIVRLSTSGGDRFDPIWIHALASLRLFLSLAGAFEFPRGATLVNLGSSWWLQNYFLLVRHAKKIRGIRYVPFVHDLIPVMAPEHCVRALTQDFIGWLLGVFDHADHFLVNSHATRSDLLSVAGQLGYELDPADVAVIPLDTDFRKCTAAELPAQALDRWQLSASDFVLFVSTIESRKGHLIAFDAWADLIERHGIDAIPRLVCVGNNGWLNDQIYGRLASEPALSAKVSMLSRLTDEELSLLYRSCLFTIYPSLYEGWGLPVTESLCHGKVPLISDAASLPEAGGDFAVYAAAGSASALAGAAEKLILDADHRGALEARIVAGFRPRAWSELARQITGELDCFAQRDSCAETVAVPSPAVEIGAWHPITRNASVRIWKGLRTGEGFRSNLGWNWPEERGCTVRAEGGELRLRLDGPHPALRIAFRLTGGDIGPSRWRIRLANCMQTGEIGPGEDQWVPLDIAAGEATRDVDVRFEAIAAADGEVSTYLVGGFFIHAAEDYAARDEFVEAVALGRLDTMDAYRER